MQLLLSAAAKHSCLRIADEGGLRAQSEVARTYAKLESLRRQVATVPDFWNVGDCAKGILESHITLKFGSPLWRLYPRHTHCIALLAEVSGILMVLDFCRRVDLADVERELAARY